MEDIGGELMGRNWTSWVMLTFFGSVAAYLWFGAQHWPGSARTLPFAVSLLGTALAIINLLAAYLEWIRRYLSPSTSINEGHGIDLPENIVKTRSLQAIAWIGFLFLVVFLIGFHLGIPLFLLAYMLVSGKATLMAALILTVGTWLAIFVLLSSVMRIPWLTPWLPIMP